MREDKDEGQDRDGCGGRDAECGALPQPEAAGCQRHLLVQTPSPGSSGGLGSDTRASAHAPRLSLSLSSTDMYSCARRVLSTAGIQTVSYAGSRYSLRHVFAIIICNSFWRPYTQNVNVNCLTLKRESMIYSWLLRRDSPRGTPLPIRILQYPVTIYPIDYSRRSPRSSSVRPAHKFQRFLATTSSFAWSVSVSGFP